jgi:hypothetical protein
MHACMRVHVCRMRIPHMSFDDACRDNRAQGVICVCMYYVLVYAYELSNMDSRICHMHVMYVYMYACMYVFKNIKNVTQTRNLRPWFPYVKLDTYTHKTRRDGQTQRRHSLFAS